MEHLGRPPVVGPCSLSSHSAHGILKKPWGELELQSARPRLRDSSKDALDGRRVVPRRLAPRLRPPFSLLLDGNGRVPLILDLGSLLGLLEHSQGSISTTLHVGADSGGVTLNKGPPLLQAKLLFLLLESSDELLHLLRSSRVVTLHKTEGRDLCTSAGSHGARGTKQLAVPGTVGTQQQSGVKTTKGP